MDCTEVTWKEEKSRFVAWEMDLPKKKKKGKKKNCCILPEKHLCTRCCCTALFCLSDLVCAAVGVRMRLRGGRDGYEIRVRRKKETDRGTRSGRGNESENCEHLFLTLLVFALQFSIIQSRLKSLTDECESKTNENLNLDWFVRSASML